ncbi:UNVERIFIED_CONTAM: hypothetical protein NCL1_36229 [Trichonephila clavipes]
MNNGTAKNNVRFHILYGLNSVFGYPNNRVSERCPVAIDSDKRRSTAIVVVCCPTRMQNVPKTFFSLCSLGKIDQTS